MTEAEIENLLPSMHYAMLCYQHGKLQEFIDEGNGKPHEELYQCFFDVLYIATDFLADRYDEGYMVTTIYLSSKAMMEFYRLCRTFSVKRGISLKDNPFMLEAQRNVEHAMDLGDYGGYGFTLQTKINHEWASGLVIQLDDNYFNSEFELAEAVLSIFDWYTEGVIRLKKAISEPTIMTLPVSAEQKEAA